MPSCGLRTVIAWIVTCIAGSTVLPTARPGCTASPGSRHSRDRYHGPAALQRRPVQARATHARPLTSPTVNRLGHDRVAPSARGAKLNGGARDAHELMLGEASLSKIPSKILGGTRRYRTALDGLAEGVFPVQMVRDGTGRTVGIRLLIRRFRVRLPGGAQKTWSAAVAGPPSADFGHRSKQNPLSFATVRRHDDAPSRAHGGEWTCQSGRLRCHPRFRPRFLDHRGLRFCRRSSRTATDARLARANSQMALPCSGRCPRGPPVTSDRMTAFALTLQTGVADVRLDESGRENLDEPTHAGPACAWVRVAT